MRSWRLWETPAIEVEDMPTFQDVLKACDAKTLTRIFEEEYGRTPDSQGKDAEEAARARERFAHVVEQMRALDARRDEGWVILPQTRFSLVPDCHDGLVKVRTVAMLVRTDDLGLASSELEEGALARANGRRASDACGAMRTYSAELTPWEEALGNLIWLGGELTRRERYMVLVSYVLDLTTYGDDADEAARGARATISAIEDRDGRGRSLTPYPLQVLRARLHLIDPFYLGLERTMDDLAEEFHEARSSLVDALNERARETMLREASRLGRMLADGYGRAKGTRCEPEGQGREEDEGERSHEEGWLVKWGFDTGDCFLVGPYERNEDGSLRSPVDARVRERRWLCVESAVVDCLLLAELKRRYDPECPHPADAVRELGSRGFDFYYENAFSAEATEDLADGLARAMPALEEAGEDAMVKLDGERVIVRDEAEDDDWRGLDAWLSVRGHMRASDALRAAGALVRGLREVAEAARQAGVPVCFDGP